MEFTIRHTLDIDEDTFWKQLFFDEEFNRALYQDHLKFHTFKVLEYEEKPDGVIIRRTENAPPVEVPKAIEKALGNATSYIEDGRFDPVAKKFVFTASPTATDKIQTRGEVWCEERGEKRIERIVRVEVNAKIFGVGKVVENTIEQQTRQQYDKATEFTRQWIMNKQL